MLKFLSGVIATLLLISLLAFSFTGIVPGLSILVGASQKDLGIKTTPEQTKAAMGKVGTEVIAVSSIQNAKDGFRLEGKKDAQFTMDSTEISAHSNNRSWKNYPLRNVQIKILEDGQIESSAILVISKALPYAMNLGYSEQQIRDAMSKYNIPPVEVPIYIKGYGSVENDQVKVDAKNVKIGAINIPSNIVSQANKEAESVLEDLIQKNSHSFHCESLTFKNGQLNFKGQVAEREYVIGN